MVVTVPPRLPRLSVTSTLVVAPLRHGIGVAPPGSGRLRPRSTTVDQEFSSSFSVSCCCLIERQGCGSGTASGGTFVELADTLIDDFDVIDFLQVLAARCVELLGAGAAGIMLAGQGGSCCSS